MSSSFGLLGVESCHFSKAEKVRTACKAEQLYKTTTIFTQNNLGRFILSNSFSIRVYVEFWPQILILYAKSKCLLSLIEPPLSLIGGPLSTSITACACHVVWSQSSQLSPFKSWDHISTFIICSILQRPPPKNLLLLGKEGIKKNSGIPLSNNV